MALRQVVLTNRSSKNIPIAQLSDVAQALQTQLDRDFYPVWGKRAAVTAIMNGAEMPAHAWPIYLVDHPDAGLGVHLDDHGKPFAEVQVGNEWSITASHELLEMMEDPLGHKFIQAPDIDPGSDRHLVNYLVEVGDPSEIYSYTIGNVAVSDFVTREFYDPNAPAGSEFDLLHRLAKPLEIPMGCYISWQDPEDGRWHQKQANGKFVTAEGKIDRHGNPRDDRDKAFGSEKERGQHDLLAVRQAYGAAA